MESGFTLSDFSVKYQDDYTAEYSTEKEFSESLNEHPTEMIKWLSVACGYEGGKTSNLILENGSANKWDVKSDGKFSSIFCYTAKDDFLTEFKNYLRNYFDSLIFKYPNFIPPPGPESIE